MEAVAKWRNNPTTARKMRLVVDLVRGMEVNDALNTLKFTRKHAARDVEKVLRSAIANWTVKYPDSSIDDSALFIKKIFVDEGRTLKRFRPAPFGRAHRIRKHSHHLTIIIDSKTDSQNQENDN